MIQIRLISLGDLLQFLLKGQLKWVGPFPTTDNEDFEISE